ncbi:MAG: hypothetical protein LBS71_01010 [Puniceicoccales bacterium]|jgi:DNA repair exonuclease SbcCD ATPase subunit|nr:hypothetical protein [Puniceicoccales bacterium]
MDRLNKLKKSILVLGLTFGVSSFSMGTEPGKRIFQGPQEEVHEDPSQDDEEVPELSEVENEVEELRAQFDALQLNPLQEITELEDTELMEHPINEALQKISNELQKIMSDLQRIQESSQEVDVTEELRNLRVRIRKLQERSRRRGLTGYPPGTIVEIGENGQVRRVMSINQESCCALVGKLILDAVAIGGMFVLMNEICYLFAPN